MLRILVLMVGVNVASGFGTICDSKCKSSFPLHTYPKKDALFACLRGCRLERIEQVSKSWSLKDVTPKRNCENDCKTAYQTDTDLLNACVIGCKSADPVQPTYLKLLQEERSKAGFDNGHYYIVRPVMVVRRYCSGLYNVVVSFIGEKKSVSSRDVFAQAVTIEVRGDPNYVHVESLTDVSYSNKYDVDDQKLEVQKSGAGDSTWLGCVSYKAGIPKWFLASALITSLTAMVYLFISICCEVDTEKVHKFDGAFDSHLDDPFLSPLLLDVDQAPSLPPKYSEKGGVL